MRLKKLKPLGNLIGSRCLPPAENPAPPCCWPGCTPKDPSEGQVNLCVRAEVVVTAVGLRVVQKNGSASFLPPQRPRGSPGKRYSGPESPLSPGERGCGPANLLPLAFASMASLYALSSRAPAISWDLILAVSVSLALPPELCSVHSCFYSPSFLLNAVGRQSSFISQFFHIAVGKQRRADSAGQLAGPREP